MKPVEEKKEHTINSDKDSEIKEPETETEKDNSIKNLYSQLLRLKAEFDNYRKRTDKEKQEIFLYGKEVVLSKIVDFVEIFDKALEVALDKKDIENIIAGLELLKKEFQTFLEKEGVEFINPVGEKFDPHLHEVVGYELTEDEEDIVQREVQKGYKFGSYIIRPAKVIVSKKGPNSEETESK